MQVQHQEVHQAEEGTTRPAWLGAFSADLQAYQATAQEVNPQEVPAEVTAKATEAPALNASKGREEVPPPTHKLGALEQPATHAGSAALRKNIIGALLEGSSGEGDHPAMTLAQEENQHQHGVTKREPG